MAETLHIDPSTEAATLSKARHAVCLEAAWEIEALALTLPDLVGVDVSYDGGTGFVVRGVAARMNELAKALQAGLFDEVVTVRELQRRVLLDADWGMASRWLTSISPSVLDLPATLEPA